MSLLYIARAFLYVQRNISVIFSLIKLYMIWLIKFVILTYWNSTD
uniref:Uncharacterized protein n=1 Tax=Siphoviridae sp. ctZd434 TaxID=2825559 RepID=A0A8S5UHB4_9CAUD|nr:MAG TPA: hypothetical protein [Siphoviridae sp. ctZd434]